MEILGNSWITKDVTLSIALVLTVLLTIAIPLAARRSKLTLLDGIASPSKARDILDRMDQNQKDAHIWITATLDVAYPLSYGGLFAGSALRFFPEYGSYLALPALLAIMADLTEGVIQILALTDTSDLLYLKKYVTPLKYGMAILGLVIALVGLGLSLI
ncbi:MAG: hypothetical protein AB4372_04660 [Xenococcus sp. (in: cyanobacteria)]